jgi:hypothetical protein
MSLILDGTNGLSDVDGSAATPAIRGSDANTGVFFPAADTIAFAEGGAEAMRLNSAGSLCVGSVHSGDAGTVTVSIGNPGTTSGGLQLWAGSAQEHYIQWGDSTSGTDTYRGAISYTHASDAMKFWTGSTERMRIDSSGNLLVGTTSPITGGSKLTVSGNNGDWMAGITNTNASPRGLFINHNTDSNGTANWFLYCEGGSTQRMSVRSNGGIANFSANNVNLSDRREKTNFAPAKSYLDTICAIPVQTFNYIDQNHEEDPGLTLGVVAQDVQDVAPELVMESNWGTAEEPKMRLSVYQTDLQYALMKCIQEQQANITALTARVEALEGAQA